MNKPTILVVEDDSSVRSLITTTLKAHGYKFLTAANGEMAVMMASSHNPDIMLLDLGLPDIDGVEVIRRIREWSNLPIIVLSARSEDSDKIEALDQGADDYLTKPFHREELIMRLKALLKRTGHFFDDDGLTAGPFVVHVTSHEVLINDQPVALNGKEFDLLVYLLQNQKTIITKDQIFDRLWGFDSETAVSVVEVYMSNLRKKLKPLKVEHWIKTIRNVGYIFQEPEGSE